MFIVTLIKCCICYCHPCTCHHHHHQFLKTPFFLIFETYSCYVCNVSHHKKHPFFAIFLSQMIPPFNENRTPPHHPPTTPTPDILREHSSILRPSTKTYFGSRRLLAWISVWTATKYSTFFSSEIRIPWTMPTIQWTCNYTMLLNLNIVFWKELVHTICVCTHSYFSFFIFKL